MNDDAYDANDDGKSADYSRTSAKAGATKTKCFATRAQYGRSSKVVTGPPGSYLSKSAPIAAQAQAYLEQNVRARSSPKKYGQMLVRSGPQDKPMYQSGGEMYHPLGSESPLPGHYNRPAHYGMQGSNFINTPYMQQQPSTMQAYHQQQQFRNQQQLNHQQQQQFNQQQQQQFNHQQFNPQQQQFNQQQFSPQQQHYLGQPTQQQQHQQQQQQHFPPNYQHYNHLNHSQSAPASPVRIQSPPPRVSRIMSPPPPSSPSLSMISASSPPPSASAAASFFARAAQKLSKKKKRHHQPEPEPPPFPTNYAEILRISPPPCPPCLLRDLGRLQNPGAGKVKVMLRVVSSSNYGDQSSSFLHVDARNKQVTVHDPAGSGYATSAAHRKAAMAPKMFAFDAVFAPDNCLAEVCAGSLTEIIQGVVSGADGCLFTYGYSKLGKSYTMFGKDQSAQTLGIAPCAIAWLYKLINEQKDHTGARFSVRVSAVEVSGKQEQLKDLLAEVAKGTETGVSTAPGVYLREDPITGTQLENQSELRAPTADRAAYYLDAALAARAQPEEEGRSSHILFTLHVYQYRIEKENKAGLPGVAGGRSRLHLIDLGSASKSKDPDNVALSLSALGNVIMALLNGQRHVPHRNSKVAQLLRDSLGNFSCRTCMVAHVSQAVPHYNESLQVVQLAARIHRMRRRRMKQFSGTSSDESSSTCSTDDGRIRTRPFRGCRMGTLREDTGHMSSLSDPDYTSSSEQSCDTVIYLGRHGQSLSDRELTDHEGPPRSVPRTNPRLPRRASGSKSSGDEGSNSDSGRSLYRSRDSLSRLQTKIASPVRDVSVTDSRQGTPIRDSHSLSRNATPVRDIQNGDVNSLSTSPPCVTFNLPPQVNTRSRSSKQEGCYASVNIVDKLNKTGARTKRPNPSREDLGNEQWIDGPGAAIYPEKKNTGEQWVDGPRQFVVKPEPKSNKSNPKRSSEELWVDGPREMIADGTESSPSHTPKVAMHTSSKKAHVRMLSAEKGSSPPRVHQSPNSSPAHQPKADRVATEPSRQLHDIKERPESMSSMDSNTSNTAQAPDSRPTSMVSNNEDAHMQAESLDTQVKPFVRDWVEKHGMSLEEEAENRVGYIVNDDNQMVGTLESAPASYRRPKPQECRTKKLTPSSSTPKHSPKSSPATARKSRSSTPKLQKSQLPVSANPTKRVTDWLRSVECNQPEETIIYKETMSNSNVITAGLMNELERQNVSEDISLCSSVNDNTLSESLTHGHSASGNADTTNDSNIADMSFDSSVDTANSVQNRESIYELQMDEQLEKALDDTSGKCGTDVADDETFSNASCAKESDVDTDAEDDETAEIGDMKKSDTIQSIKTLVGDIYGEDNLQKNDINEKVCNDDIYKGLSQLTDLEKMLNSLSRKPDGASNPNLSDESYSEKKTISSLRNEYLIANAMSSQSPELEKKLQHLSPTSKSKTNTLTRNGAGDGQMDCKQITAKPPLPQKPCSKCGYSQQNSKPMSKLCKECQKMVAQSIKNSHTLQREKDKLSKHNNSHSSSSGGSPSSTGMPQNSKSKSQSPSHSRLPIFLSKNCSASLKDAKINRKKEKESKKLSSGSDSRSKHARGHDSDSGNDSGIVNVEKKLLSPYATVTKPRTVSHSSSGHGSDNSSNVSTDLHSKPGSTSDKLHGGTSSGYESMLRDSEVSGSSTAQEESASESSSERKKGSKKKHRSSTRRSRSAPAHSSDSPDTCSRKSSPSSKNSSLSPTSKAWLERHKTKEEPLEIKDYGVDDLKRINRHRNDDDPPSLRKNHEKRNEITNKEPHELANGKDQYIVDRDSWTFDCNFLMCFSCRSKPKKTSV